MTMEASKPRIEIADVLGGGMIALGFLLFLVGLHLMTIRSVGDTASVLNKVLVSFIWVYVGALTLGFVVGLIQVLRWLVWTVQTPDWKKRRGE